MTATLTTFQSDVLLGTVQSGDLGYNFEEAVVTIKAGMKMGAALESTSVAGKYTWVATATVADCDAVLIDPLAQGYVATLPAGDHTLVVAKRGSTINQAFFAVESGTTADAIKAFEKAGANKVTDKVFGQK
ncbi:hypothetical protein NVP1101O_107 [Vibrio phage 1.101.O._10N.261.45.C6]|nr:hypothetical protein NVP1101O_107 [Vibrio phage 1.101.O._10N.261.45.C6]